MARKHVDHADLAAFAQDKVNLPRDKANAYRAQARRLREKLEAYLNEHPDFSLKKMLLSGSLAKGTALKSLNDIDLACYIAGAEVPSEIAELLNYLAKRLRKAFPNFSDDQIKPQTYCVTVSFKGSGLDVDIVPILYNGDPDWYGNGGRLPAYERRRDHQARRGQLGRGAASLRGQERDPHRRAGGLVQPPLTTGSHR